jgi:hypothetical protein
VTLEDAARSGRIHKSDFSGPGFATKQFSQRRRSARNVPVFRVGRSPIVAWFPSHEQPMCTGYWPAELVIKGLPSSSGLPQSSQCSGELMPPWWNSRSGAFQSWVGPRRIRHSNPLVVAIRLVVIKTNSLGLPLCGDIEQLHDQKPATWFGRQFRRKALRIRGGYYKEIRIAKRTVGIGLGGRLSTQLAASWAPHNP